MKKNLPLGGNKGRAGERSVTVLQFVSLSW